MTQRSGESTTKTPAALERREARQLFISAVTNMSWQLAVVVLVPLIGGYELDKKLHSAPILTILGLILASLGVMSVVHRQLEQFGPAPKAPKGHKL
jgi:F0F1-type ATP synthase assembly protein I